MARRMVIFSDNSLLKLITHYTDGQAVPLDAELVGFLANPLLSRYLALEFKTSEPGPESLQVRYEGKKVLVFDPKAGTGEQPNWLDAEDRRPTS